MKMSLNQIFFLMALQDNKLPSHDRDGKIRKWALRNKLMTNDNKLTEKGQKLANNEKV